MILVLDVPDDTDLSTLPAGWEPIPTWEELGALDGGCKVPMASDGTVCWTCDLDPDDADRRGRNQHFGYRFDATGPAPYVIDIFDTWWLSFVPPDVDEVTSDTYFMIGRSDLEARLAIHHLQQLGSPHAS